MDLPFRVLLIEAEDADAELIEARIQRAGLPCTVERISTVENLKQKLESLQPDAIVCDLHMPAVSGLEVLKICRSIAPESPFILVSYLVRPFEADVAKALGATAMLDKAAHGQLITTLRNAINVALVRSYRTFSVPA